MDNTILKVKDLSINFETKHGLVRAVDRVSFDIEKGQVFALVGESGCGKSTTAMGIMRLLQESGKIGGGEIIFEEQNLADLTEDEMSHVRGKEIGMIFQNPLDSLNPVYSIGYQVSEGLIEEGKSKEEVYETAYNTLRDVKISDVESRMKSYPHEISGGMRQRVMIAMMLCRNPKLLIADEPTTALDVTIQAGIIELMNELRSKYNSSILMITHDFGIVADMADRVGVMYAGNIVEIADVFDIFDNAAHPYTKLLMKALPTITKDEGRLETIKGTVPDLSMDIKGCKFADRCPSCTEKCRQERPEMKEISKGHFVACHCCEGGSSYE